MQEQKVDWVVFIGRFQPVHNGHIHVLNEAIKCARKGVIVFCGSVNGPRTPKNPFTFNQRSNLIHSAWLKDCIITNHIPMLQVLAVKDYRYSNTAWMESIQHQVDQTTGGSNSVAMIGYHKDDSSNYLDWFPQWKFISVDVDESAETINATDIRDILFDNKNTAFLSGVLPQYSMQFLNEFKQTPEYARLKQEHEINQAYKRRWSVAPFPPTFVTTDAVVTCAGHILMIQRGDAPGKGQWALPGGFLEMKERIVDGAVRELKEETEIDISEKALKGLIRAQDVFDSPNRDARGRCITHAFLFVVDTFKGKLPKVRGSDDAADAKWIPIAELDETIIFADHYDIIMKLLGMQR